MIAAVCLILAIFFLTSGARDKTGRAVLELYGDHWGWSSTVTSQELFMMLLYFYSINRYPLERNAAVKETRHF